MSKLKKNHPWKKFSMKKNEPREERNIGDILSIKRSEQQREMVRNPLTHGLRSKEIMDNDTLTNL